MQFDRRRMLGGVLTLAAAGTIPARAQETCPPRTFPIPSTASPQLQALILARKGDEHWKLKPTSAAEWHKIVDTSTAEILKHDEPWPAKYGVTIREASMGGVPVFWVTPKQIRKRDRRRLLLNFHGGAYVYAPGRSGLEDAMLMASRGFRVVSVDYRMLPDHPYPAAMDDAEAVWRALSAKAHPRRLGIFGTSTGGGMTLALIHRCKRKNLKLPAAVWAGTPWSDLTRTGDSYFTNEFVDSGLVSYDGILEAAASAYAAGHDLRDPDLSPVYGDFAHFPPTLLTTGTRDLFLSNTVRVHRKLRDAGVFADLTIIEALSHADYAALPDSPESAQVYGDAAAFFRHRLAV